MKKTSAPSNLEAFITGFPPEVQAILGKLRDVVRKAAPGAEEAIKYGIPTLVLKGRNLVHFSAYPRHVGFYPTPAVLEAFRDELKDYTSGKGSVQFPLDQPMPYALIERMVAYRVAMVLGEADAAAGAGKPAARTPATKAGTGRRREGQGRRTGAGRARS